MALLEAILLLMVSAACEGNNWTEEEKLISSQLTSKQLEGQCHDIMEDDCNNGVMQSFWLKLRIDMRHDKLWLDSIVDIVKDIETIGTGTDIKQTYQSIIHAAFNILNDLLNNYYDHDNKIKDISPRTTILGEIEHRINTTFATTEEIILLREIVKDVILLSKIEFKDLIKIKNLTENIVAFNRAVRYNAVTYDVYQPVIMNLPELLRVVSTKGYNSTRLSAFVVSLDNTINEFKNTVKVWNKFIPSSEFNATIRNLTSALREQFKSIFGNIIKSFISVLTQKPAEVKNVNDLLVELTKLKEDFKAIKGNDDAKEVLKLLESLTGFVQNVVPEWTYSYQSSNFDDTIKLVTIVLQEINGEIQRSPKDFQKTIQTINEYFDERIEIIKSSLAPFKKPIDPRNRILNVIYSFISELNKKPSEDEAFHEYQFVHVLKILKEDLKTVKRNEDVKGVLKLLEKVFGFYGKFLSEWTNVYQAWNFDDTLNKAIYFLIDLSIEIGRSPKDFQTIIRNIDDSFDKRIEIIKSSMAITKRLTDTRNKTIKIIKNFITVFVEKPSEVKTYKDYHDELTTLKEDLKRGNENEDVNEVLKLLENLFGFYGIIVSEWTYVYQYSNFDETIKNVTIFLEEITKEIQSSSTAYKAIIKKINESFDKHIEIITSSMGKIKHLIDTRNKIINIIKGFISVFAHKPFETSRFDYAALENLRKHLHTAKGNEDYKETWKLVDTLSEFIHTIDSLYFEFVQELEVWAKAYFTSKFNDTIDETLVFLEETAREIQSSSKDFQTIIGKINESFEKRIEIIDNYRALIDHLYDKRYTLIDIINRFISVLAQKPKEVNKFNVWLIELKKLKEESKKEEGNKYAEEIFKLLDNLAGFFQNIVSDWTNFYQSPVFDEEIKEVTIVLEDLNGEIERSSNIVQTATQINELFDKRIEKMNHSLAEIKKQIETRNKVINIIKSFITVLDKEPTQVKKVYAVYNELTQLKDDLRTVMGNVDVMEFLKLLQSLISHVRGIASEWTSVDESSNFDDKINIVKTFLKDLSGEIQKILYDKDTMKRVNNEFPKRMEIIRRILDNSKQLKEARYKVNKIIQSFIAVMAKKPSSIEEFNKTFDGIRKLQDELKKKVTGNSDLTVVLELIENILLLFQDILQQWNKVYQSPEYEDTIKNLASILKELGREIKQNRNDFEKIKEINISFSKRKDKIKQILLKINTDEQIKICIQDFLNQISARLPYKENITALISKITSIDQALRQNPMITTETENYLRLTEKFVALLNNTLEIWDYLHFFNYEGSFYEEVSSVLQDIIQVDTPSKRNESNVQYTKIMTIYLDELTNIFLEMEDTLPPTWQIVLLEAPLVNIFRGIMNLAGHEDTRLIHFNRLIRDIKSLYYGTAQNNELKKEIEKIYNVFKALTPIIKVNTDLKIEETFISKFRQLVKDTWLAVIDNKLIKSTEVFLTQLRRLIDETEKKVFSDGLNVFQEILNEIRNLSRENEPTLSHFQDTLNIIKIYDEEIIQSKSNQNDELKSLTQSLYNLFKDVVSVLESKRSQPKNYNSIVLFFKTIVQDTLDAVAPKARLKEIEPNYNLFINKLIFFNSIFLNQI